MVAFFNFGGFAVHERISVPIFGLRHRYGIGHGLAIDKQANATAFEAVCHVRAEHELTCSHYVHGVFEPFAGLGITDGVTLASVGRIHLHNVDTIFAVGAAFVHKVLVVERNALAAFIVIFELHDSREGELNLVRSLFHGTVKVCERNFLNVADVAEFLLDTGVVHDVIAVIVIGLLQGILPRLILAHTCRGILEHVFFHGKAAGAFVQVNGHVPVVGPLGRSVIVDIVVLDFATGALVRERVDRAGVAKQAGNMVNLVPVHMVIGHGGLLLGPAKTNGNTGVISVRNFVMFDHHIAGVTGANTYGTLMFISHVGNQVVLDRIAGTDFFLVGRIVGNMNFGRGVLIELAEHNACSADFEEGIALDHVVVGARDKVEARSRNLREYVTLYQKMMRIFDAERRIGAPQQILVTVQLFPVSAARIRKDIHIEVCCLQI